MGNVWMIREFAREFLELVLPKENTERAALGEVVFTETLASLQVAGCTCHHPQNWEDGLVPLSTSDVDRVEEVQPQVLRVLLEAVTHRRAIEVLARNLGL